MDSHKRSTQLERLEVVETGRRRRWSDDEKLRIVSESFEAPRAISSTARRHGISRSLLMTWRDLGRAQSSGASPSRNALARSGPSRSALKANNLALRGSSWPLRSSRRLLPHRRVGRW
ncbi:transposase [Bradyrhizobium sp. F1.4.3]|uniref:transposase n=1 Tax=Bradyrhizobium sp. F1.4.3 TaxID=3156356 RepID=UPI003397F18F